MPSALSLIAGIILFAMGVTSSYALICFIFSVFVIITILMEFYRGTRARIHTTGENPLLALWRLTTKNKRRYGGYVVHLGVVCMFIGMAASGAYKIEKEVSLKIGQEFNIADYTIKLDRFTQYPTQNKMVNIAELPVYKNGKKIYTLTPEKNIHFKNSEQPVSEVSIHWNLKEDLYIILAGFDSDQQATFKVVINPLMVWLWIGGIVMALGSIIAIWPNKRRPLMVKNV